MPGGPIAKRPLHFFWMCDCSGSMAGEKINQLNFSVKNALPGMKEAARDNHTAQLFMHVIKFASGAQWVIGDPVPVEQFNWIDLDAQGVTDMGQALELVADKLQSVQTPRGLPPVLVLVSDGQPTDDFDGGLKKLMALPIGQKSLRIAIAIGKDADLPTFIANSPKLEALGLKEPLIAETSDQLKRYIIWVTTSLLTPATSTKETNKEDFEPPVLFDSPDSVTF